ncbi:hypothetical protein DFR70_111230 [Nocardia tenerifensis]|uniref:Uncharacterized protein n=1 Tax=Nocardia tenerifensis TaxID=228006 RepID=A0A318JXT8_9NOCA|nr:hypothetical protein [Nocardia tenerifensis]PXX59843.1 hypothetical protein DFR70_111230 [Nocardia tenerifensis]
MGEFRSFTKTELEQFERDQQDPKWLEWLAPENMNMQLDVFLNETVPDMPGNPWSSEGLERAERAALSIFPTVDSTMLPENRGVADQFHRFVGEVFRRNFEGVWRNVPTFDDAKRSRRFGPVVARPFAEFYLGVIQTLTTAIDRQTGNTWSQAFRYSEEDYQTWVETGRPTIAGLKD